NYPDVIQCLLFAVDVDQVPFIVPGVHNRPSFSIPPPCKLSNRLFSLGLDLLVDRLPTGVAEDRVVVGCKASDIPLHLVPVPPDDFISEVGGTENLIHQEPKVMMFGLITVQIDNAVLCE